MSWNKHENCKETTYFYHPEHFFWCKNSTNASQMVSRLSRPHLHMQAHSDRLYSIFLEWCKYFWKICIKILFALKLTIYWSLHKKNSQLMNHFCIKAMPTWCFWKLLIFGATDNRYLQTPFLWNDPRTICFLKNLHFSCPGVR